MNRAAVHPVLAHRPAAGDPPDDLAEKSGEIAEIDDVAAGVDDASADAEAGEAEEVEGADEVEEAEEAEEAEEGDSDGEEPLVVVRPKGDRTATLIMDIDEGRYNARDVLGMCRVYPLLAQDVDRLSVNEVYEVDRRLAEIALQMTRAGMPIDVEEKERVGKHLREIRDAAVVELRAIVNTDLAKFIDHVAMLQAASVRKKDPAQGKPTWVKYQLDGKPTPKHPEGRPVKDAAGNLIVISEGPPHSHESAFLARKEIRGSAFKAAIEKHGEHKKGLNFGAKIQQAAILQMSGVPLLTRTEKTALPKIDKDVLEQQQHHAVARAMLRYTLAVPILRTFIDGLQLDADNRLRPQWITHKITGRWGSSPNVQNWSKRAGGGAENLRRMIAAPPGYKLVGADQAQLEARIIAADSQDPFLVDIFKSGKDIHGEIAGVVFPEWAKLAAVFKEHKGTLCGLPPSCIKCNKTAFTDKGACLACGYDSETKCDFCKRRDKMRDITKRLEYGGFYGGAPDTLWQAVVKDFPDFPISGVHAFLALFNQKMQRVVQWRVERLNQAIKDGEIRSPILGRRQVFPMGRVDPTVIYNWGPQSGGADLWDLGAIEFCDKWDQTRDDVRLVHNGHDSVLIITREDLVLEVSADVHRCWEREWKDVPFKMDVKVGYRWSEV